MSILSSKGISIPTFQPASNKGNDSQGNGSGGMFFQQGQEQQNPFDDYDFGFMNDHNDDESQPFHVPLFGPEPVAMKLWKAVIAKQLYEKLNRDKALAAAQQ